MVHISFNQDEKLIFSILILFYVVFFISLIIDDHSSWSLTYSLAGLILYCTLRRLKFYFNTRILVISFASIFLISTLEFSIFSQQSTTNLFLTKVFKDYNQQFFYIVLLAFIPFLFNITQIKLNFFKLIILGSIIFSLIYNSYLNIIFDFSRSNLITHFKSIILYDYCIIALSLIGLILSFESNKKWSYVLILLCLINISMIVLHGSRGAWIGIPFALTCIACFNYHTKPLQTGFMIFSSILLSTLLSMSPDSPIQQRIQDLQNDTAMIHEQQNYNSSVGTRVALWGFSWHQFKQSPWIGHGITEFSNQICDSKNREAVPDCQPHAHNILLQSLAAYGIIGLIHLIIIYFYPLWISISTLCSTSSKQNKLISFSITVFLLYLGVCSMSDYLFFLEFPTMFYFLMLITLLSFLHNDKSSSQSELQKKHIIFKDFL